MQALDSDEVLTQLKDKKYVAITSTLKDSAAEVLRAVLGNKDCMDDAIIPEHQVIGSNLALFAAGSPAQTPTQPFSVKNLSEALERAHLTYEPGSFTVASVQKLDSKGLLQALVYIPYPEEKDLGVLRKVAEGASMVLFPVSTADYDAKKMDAYMTFLSTCNPTIAVPVMSAEGAKAVSPDIISDHVKKTYGAMAVSNLNTVSRMVQVAPHVDPRSFLGIRNSLFRLLQSSPRIPAGAYEAGCIKRKEKKKGLITAGATAATATAATALITSGVLLQVIPGLGTVTGAGLIASGLGALGLGGLAASTTMGSAAFMGVIAACGCTIASKYAVDSMADRAFDSYTEHFSAVEQDQASSANAHTSGGAKGKEGSDTDSFEVPTCPISAEMEASIRAYLAAIDTKHLPSDKDCGKDYETEQARTDLVFLYFDPDSGKECPIDIKKKGDTPETEDAIRTTEEGGIDTTHADLNTAGNLYCISGLFKKDALVAMTSVLRLVVKEGIEKELASIAPVSSEKRAEKEANALP